MHWNSKYNAAAAVLALALAAGATVVYQTHSHPRTDDASVRANFIQFAPEVSGRVTALAVKDNQYVHKGDLLLTIDSRPYEYALTQALADQQLLEKQIEDATRKIAAEASAVRSAHAGVISAKTHASALQNASQAAHAASDRASAAVGSAEAQLQLATNNLHRLEPLLAKQYVTVEQVDEARTRVQVAERNVAEARAAARQAHMLEAQSAAQSDEASAGIDISQAHLEERTHLVDSLDTLIAQRPIKSAHVDDARLNLERCRIVAPFDGYVNNLNLSEGEYAKPGVPVFTLIDARQWYVVASYRETELRHIHTGAHVDVYLMGDASRHFDGVVESLGYGVAPEDAATANGLPQVDRTLNWVHLSARFPVRIRMVNPDAALFRMGETATTIVR